MAKKETSSVENVLAAFVERERIEEIGSGPRKVKFRIRKLAVLDLLNGDVLGLPIISEAVKLKMESDGKEPSKNIGKETEEKLLQAMKDPTVVSTIVKQSVILGTVSPKIIDSKKSTKDAIGYDDPKFDPEIRDELSTRIMEFAGLKRERSEFFRKGARK